MKFSFANIENIYELIQELMTGVTRLSFDDNFESFEVKDVSIKSGDVASITNSLTVIPSKYIITAQEGGSIVAKTNTNRWNTDTVYLKNYGTDDVTISVIFMK